MREPNTHPPAYVYIGGSGRSGTTMLRRALSLKGKAICFNEPKFMVAEDGFRDLVRGAIGPLEFSKAMLLTHAPRIEETTGLGRETLSQILSSAASESSCPKSFTRNFLKRYHAALNRLHTGLILVEKEPHVLEMAALLSGQSTATRFIHIFRDPRDVCCSVIASTWGPKNAQNFIEWYARPMRTILESQDKTPQDRYALISLETLCANPEPLLKALFKLMGFTPTHGELAFAVSVIDPGKANLSRYKKELDPAQAELVMQRCAPIHDELKRREKAWLHKACPELQLP